MGKIPISLRLSPARLEYKTSDSIPSLLYSDALSTFGKLMNVLRVGQFQAAAFSPQRLR